MTRKLYKSARGKMVDMGTLILQNENVRAVGNMGVNARGDLVDGTNKVIDQKSQQIQRQVQRQTTTNVGGQAPHSSIREVQRANQEQQNADLIDGLDNVASVTEPIAPTDIIESPAPVETASLQPKIPRGGLAAAIARTREVKQEKEKTPRELRQQSAGVTKI
jgi:hypothetical protein